MKWLENPESVGFRFAGFCDELRRSIRHTGWYTGSEICDETYRGVVYQLPHGRFYAGHSDPWNDGPARLDLSECFDDASDAAITADSIAENVAESEREYQDSYRAGQWARDAAYDATQCAAHWRDTCRLLIDTYRANAAPDSVKTAARVVQDAWRDFEIASDKAHALRDDAIWNDAFKEGYGI